MGGKNPQVILDDANLQQAVELSVQSAFFSTGQRCTASSRLIVTEGIHDAFVEGVKARLAGLKIGDALTAWFVFYREGYQPDLHRVDRRQRTGARRSADHGT